MEESLQSLIRIILRKEPPCFKEEQFREIISHIYAAERERTKQRKTFSLIGESGELDFEIDSEMQESFEIDSEMQIPFELDSEIQEFFEMDSEIQEIFELDSQNENLLTSDLMEQ